MKVKFFFVVALSSLLLIAGLQVAPLNSSSTAKAESFSSVKLHNSSLSESSLLITDPLGYWSSSAPSSLAAGLSAVTVAPFAAAWPSITAGKCLYEQRSDWPHISNSLDVSVHGWWTTSTKATCPGTASVTAYLQASRCSWFGCNWVTVAVGPGVVVFPGGGAGSRDNARIRCADRVTPVAFRGGTDVDLIGVNDPSGITWGAPREGTNALLCAPS